MQDSLIYNPIWDRSRAHMPGRVYEDDSLTIVSNFECGNGYHFRRLGTNHYAFECEPEPGAHVFSGLGYYFCVALLNKEEQTRRVTVEVTGSGKGEHFGRDTRFAILKRGNNWSHIPDEYVLAPKDEGTAVFQVDLPRRSETDPVIFVSNYHWYPYTEMGAYLQELTTRRPEIRLQSIGKSALGRDLWAVEIGRNEKDAPTIVCAATTQPSEMGHHACRAILDFLSSEDPRAVQARSQHRFCLIPHPNPDGTVLGYVVSDARGNFPYFEADRAWDEKGNASVEVEAVWRYLVSVRPWLYIEWHSNNWDRRPGQMLLRYAREFISDPVTLRLWADFEHHLQALPDTYEESLTTLTQGFTTTMGAGAALKLGTIPIMIKQHDKFPLAQSREHAIASVLAATETFEKSANAGKPLKALRP